MKQLLLSAEAMFLVVPLSAALCYTSILTLVLGIPASVMQLFDSNAVFDPFLPLSAVGNVAGVYALVVLWSLIIKTIQERLFTFSFHFKLAIASGVVASVCLVVIYGWLALLFGVLPPAVVAAHFTYLQKSRAANA